MTQEPQEGATVNHWSAYKIRQGKKRAFLVNYIQTGSITAAAEAAGIARCTHYQWLEEDEDYGRAFVDAQDRYVEKLEREADRRAVDGTLRPVFYQGAIAGHVHEYSDILLIFRLKALAPDRYRENISQELKHSGKVSIDQVVVFAPREPGESGEGG